VLHRKCIEVFSRCGFAFLISERDIAGLLQANSAITAGAWKYLAGGALPDVEVIARMQHMAMFFENIELNGSSIFRDSYIDHLLLP